MPTKKQVEDFKLDQRIEDLIRAAKGMTTEEAVRGIEIFKKFKAQMKPDMTDDEFTLVMKLMSTMANAAGGHQEAVRYLEHGPEMVNLIKYLISCGHTDEGRSRADTLLAKLESK
jgi:hypothetical protein